MDEAERRELIACLETRSVNKMLTEEDASRLREAATGAIKRTKVDHAEPGYEPFGAAAVDAILTTLDRMGGRIVFDTNTR